MVLRIYRLDDDEWRRLAAARRAEDYGGLPARATIAAIEVELRDLGRATDRMRQPARP